MKKMWYFMGTFWSYVSA